MLEGEREADGVVLGDAEAVGADVGDIVASAGANATLWYSMLDDEGPAREVHTPLSVSNLTTWLADQSGVTVVVYNT